MYIRMYKNPFDNRNLFYVKYQMETLWYTGYLEKKNTKEIHKTDGGYIQNFYRRVKNKIRKYKKIEQKRKQREGSLRIITHIIDI